MNTQQFYEKVNHIKKRLDKKDLIERISDVFLFVFALISSLYTVSIIVQTIIN